MTAINTALFTIATAGPAQWASELTGAMAAAIGTLAKAVAAAPASEAPLIADVMVTAVANVAESLLGPRRSVRDLSNVVCTLAINISDAIVATPDTSRELVRSSLLETFKYVCKFMATRWASCEAPIASAFDAAVCKVVEAVVVAPAASRSAVADMYASYARDTGKEITRTIKAVTSPTETEGNPQTAASSSKP